MPSEIIIPARVLRTFVCEHRNYYFVYGNDLAGKGCMGQAWQLANEPNTFAVPTCLKLCPSSTNRFYFDGLLEEYKVTLADYLSRIPNDGNPIIPLPGIGRGCSQLYLFAPAIYKYLWEQLNKIAYPNIVIKYN